MQGDQSDILYRLKQVLPLRWFPDNTPVLDTLLGGIAGAWAWVYQLLQYVKAQTRISTAEGIWLDLIAVDYFGSQFTRRPAENDTAYCQRIRSELFRQRGTRQGVVSALQDLTGRFPVIFEPGYTFDTGGFGNLDGAGGGLAYGSAGGWGSLQLPMQCFVTAYRPAGGGIASVSGWGCCGGGYGAGALEYADISTVEGCITDADIYAAVSEVLPVGTVAWTRITS